MAMLDATSHDDFPAPHTTAMNDGDSEQGSTPERDAIGHQTVTDTVDDAATTERECAKFSARSYDAHSYLPLLRYRYDQNDGANRRSMATPAMRNIPKRAFTSPHQVDDGGEHAKATAPKLQTLKRGCQGDCASATRYAE